MSGIKLPRGIFPGSLIAGLSLLIWGSTGEHARAQIGKELGAEECSIFQNVFLNAAGIKSGDVVVTITSTLDTVKDAEAEGNMEGVFSNSELQFRCIFDLDRETFCVLRKQGPDRVTDLADPSDQPNPPSVSYDGWAIDYPHKKLFLAGHKEAAPWRLTKNLPLPDVLARNQYIDPRLTLYLPTVGLLKHEPDMSHSLFSGKQFWEKKVVGDRLQIVMFSGQYVDGATMGTWEFDLKNSLPVGFSEQNWHAGDRKFYPGEKGTMEWSVVDHYDVMSQMTWDHIGRLDSVNGKTYPGHRETIVKMKWLSVNRELDPRFFDGSAMQTPADIQRNLRVGQEGKGDTATSPTKK